MPSSQEIAKVMAEMDRFNQSAKVTVTEERYEKRVASVGGSYGGLTALLQQGAPGNWASDHKSEAEKFAGWHYVAISSIGKAIRSANCEAYQEKVREYAKAYNEQDDDSEPLPKWHPLMKLLKRPNPSQSGASFREEVAIQLCLTGSALIWNVPNQMGRTVERYVIPTAIAEPRQPERGRPKGGWYINPEVARWQIESGWFLYTGLATAIGKVIDARDVQVVRFIHPIFKDEGQSPVSAGALWTDTSEKVDVSRHSHLRNGSDPSVIIGVDGVEDEGTLQRMSAKFNEKYAGPSKHGKAMFVNAANVKIEPVTRTPAEMAYEGAFLQFRDAIMALHGVTPIAAGIEAPSGDDGLYAPLKQFISGTVQPILDLMAEEDTEQLAGQFGEGISVLYTAKAIDDAKLTEQQINTDIAAGAIEVDEIRKIRGRKPWGGEKGKAVAGQGAKEEPKPGLPGLAQGVPGLEPQTGPQTLDPSKPPQGTPDPMKLAEEAVAKALGGFADRLSALLKSVDNCGTGAGGFQEGNTCGQRRAKKGGQVGMNGEFYAGGQFLPSTDMPKKVRADMARIASGKSKVDEGVYETLTPGEFAPYEMIGTFLEKAGRDGEGRLQVRASNDTALAYMGVDTQEKMGQLQSIINRFNAGERKLQIFDYPSFPSAKDIVRALNANLPIPESMLPRLQGNLAKYVTRNGEAAGKAKSDSGYVKLQPGETVTAGVVKSSDCGANGPGGGGFQAGNTCGRGDGSGGGSDGKPSKKKPTKKGKAKGVLAWAEEKFGDAEKAKNFADWFGDSKAVDADGNPVVYYHGTSSKFSEFDTTGSSDFGSHFGTSTQANDFTEAEGSRVIPVYLSVQNPLELPDLERWNFESMSQALSEHGITVEDSPYKIETADMGENYRRKYRRQFENIASAMEAAGYDSIVYRNEHEGDKKSYSYIVLRPHQVKSALANSGKFDVTSGDISKTGDNCGANAQGGGGFQPGNTCGREEGGGASGKPNPKIVAWARKRFGSDEAAENFAKWFGDSKVVDDEGNPLTVYHGTNRTFNEFDSERQRDDRNFQFQGNGFFFTEDQEVASKYADAAANQTVDKETIISEMKEKHPGVLSDLLENIVELGHEQGWDATLEKHKLTGVPVMDWPQELQDYGIEIGRIAEVVEGTKVGRNDSDISDTFASILGGNSGRSLDSVEDTMIKLGLTLPAPQIMPVYLRAEKVLDTDSQEAAKTARERGYDAVRYTGPDRVGDSPEWIVYEPTQIKSAIGNSGAFSSESADIRKSAPSPKRSRKKAASKPAKRGTIRRKKGK